jgi:hypothetical protein
MLSSLIGYLQAALPSCAAPAPRWRRSSSWRDRLPDHPADAHGRAAAVRNRRAGRACSTADAAAGAGTLLENAIKHGIGALPEGGRIDIRATRERRRTCGWRCATPAPASSARPAAAWAWPTRARAWPPCTAAAPSLQLAAAAPRGVVATLRLPLGPADAVEAYA